MENQQPPKIHLGLFPRIWFSFYGSSAAFRCIGKFPASFPVFIPVPFAPRPETQIQWKTRLQYSTVVPQVYAT